MSCLVAIQDLIVDLLQADSVFEHVTVLPEHSGELLNDIDRALGTITVQGGKMGLCAVVMTPTASQNMRNIKGAYFDPINLVIHFEESVMVNMDAATGTLLRSYAAAERAVSVLTNQIPYPFVRPILPARDTIGIVQPLYGDRAHAARFTCAGGDAVTLLQAATPVADPAAGDAPQTVTLVCATAGAAIFYSLDGKAPTPTAGTLYTAAISVPTACTLRAKAWLAGYQASVELKVTYT